MTYSTVSRVDGGDSFLYSKECNNGDYFTVTNFSKLNNSSKWKNFFGKLPEEKNFIFEINFTGKLQTSIIPLFGHLGWSRAEIEIIEIHSMKDVTFASGVKKPNFEAETPLIEKSRQLETINNQILLFFLNNPKDEKDTDIYIADNFTIIGTFGKSFKKNNFPELVFGDLFDEIKDYDTSILKITDVKMTKENYEVHGIFSISNKNGNQQSLKYKNIFLPTKDSWLLTKTEFSKF